MAVLLHEFDLAEQLVVGHFERELFERFERREGLQLWIADLIVF